MHRIEFVRRHPRAVDLALAVTVLAAMGAVGGLYQPPGHRAFDGWAYVLTGVICLPLAARRVRPMSVLLTTSAAYLVYAALGYLPGLHFWGPVLAFYSLAAAKPRWPTAIGAAVTAVVVLCSGIALRAPLAAAVAEAVAVTAVAWGLGGVGRRLAERNELLAAATERLRCDQVRRIERALTQERLRIARELHDVVAHHMSMISMQAGLAGYVFDTDPPTARAAVDTIGTTSREALEEMRRLLVLLRESDVPATGGEPEPAPGLNQLAALADRARAGGVDVSLETSGDLESLPSGLQLTAYRVVQEALTNAIKHAGGGPVTIGVHRRPHAVTAVLRNGPGTTAARVTEPGGYGLIGMRERAKLYGGTVTAGPRPDGGFAVELTLPLT
ncbi:sensor histidine kinase [Amycolatopsis sp. MtRt-6]|uniref:sensor histidine kinase n=1 Tax=Amycolatopsis sp. MtRt-6 TaxID=2792782 RepID=UPI001A8E9332|nr:sensor histidine kinase [Amycolatopsis sp. MtRt-6]